MVHSAWVQIPPRAKLFTLKMSTNSGNCTQSDFVLQPEAPLLALHDAAFLQTVLPPKHERSVFEVAPEEYPTQPWMRHKASWEDSSQWFNYGMNVKTFKEYAAEQVRIDTELKKRYATAVGGYPSDAGVRAEK